MPRIQSKFTRHAKRREDSTHEENNQSMCFDKTDPELTQILKSANKDIKIIIDTVFPTFRTLSTDI